MVIPRYKNKIDGAIILIGYGSIGRGVLSLMEQHLNFDPTQLTIIDPLLPLDAFSSRPYNLMVEKVTKENYEAMLQNLTATGKTNLIINLAVEVSSLDLMRYASTNNCLYIDTVVEPWPGHYKNHDLSLSEQTNYTLREKLLKLKSEIGQDSVTAVSCCGANPGMVSWLVKEALLKLAADTGHQIEEVPKSQPEWAKLMSDLGVKGVHIAERDTQWSEVTYSDDIFTNTWSVEGLVAEALQPAELGWGTHEEEIPADGHTHETGCQAAIYLDSIGARTAVQTWVPSCGPTTAHLVTHNEAISISDYFTVRDDSNQVVFRPTCHYAYRPTDATMKALERLTIDSIPTSDKQHVLTPNEIARGSDELGVLLYGHSKNALWFGSSLSSEEAKSLTSAMNATGLQVASSVLAGILWMLENPRLGIVEAEELDHTFCLGIQRPYLGKVFGQYTDWKPAAKVSDLEWQFSDIRIT